MIEQPSGRRQPSWYVVHTRPRNEEQVARLLNQRLGVLVYFPQVRRHTLGRLQTSPFFPCYLFVRADLRRVALSAINTTPGVVKLVTFAERPTAVDDGDIEALQRLVDELNLRGGLVDPRLYPGAAVRLRSGPLRGLEGAFVGPTRPSARVRVLLEFLGSLRETEVPAGAVEPIGNPPEPPRSRRTRGGGRRIQ